MTTIRRWFQEVTQKPDTTPFDPNTDEFVQKMKQSRHASDTRAYHRDKKRADASVRRQPSPAAVDRISTDFVDALETLVEERP